MLLTVSVKLHIILSHYLYWIGHCVVMCPSSCRAACEVAYPLDQPGGYCACIAVWQEIECGCALHSLYVMANWPFSVLARVPQTKNTTFFSCILKICSLWTMLTSGSCAVPTAITSNAMAENNVHIPCKRRHQSSSSSEPVLSMFSVTCIEISKKNVIFEWSDMNDAMINDVIDECRG